MSSLKILYILLSGLACFLVPIGIFIYYRKKSNLMTGVVVAGGLSFYLTQMIIRIPLLQLVVPKLGFYQWLISKDHYLLLALFLGGTAALFETSGRLLTLKLLLKNRLSATTGIVHGLGHGGIEAILLVGINYLIYGLYSFLWLRGNETPLAFILPGEAGDMLKNILSTTSSQLFLIAGLERILTLIFHMAMSLLITIGLMKGKSLLYTCLVLFLHTTVDGGIVILSHFTKNPYILEGWVVIFAALSLLIIIKNRHFDPILPMADEGEKAVEEGY